MDMPFRSNRSRRRAAPPRRGRGVSLVEVLVSVLVVSVGVLGAVALQASALRNNQGSYERTQQSILSQGILDAMRANLAGVAAGNYDTGGYICAAPAAGTLAASDITRWLATMQQQIHAGACGSIACAGGACTIGVRWDDSRATGGDAAQVVQTRAQL